MARTPHRLRRVATAALGLVVIVAVIAGVLFTGRKKGGDDGPKPPPVLANLRGTDYKQTTVFSQPEPGYVNWVGAWLMPDDTIEVGFTRATGPVDPAAREKTPQSVLDAFGLKSIAPDRDFWGLDLSQRIERSNDSGVSWSVVREDHFKAIAPHAMSAQPSTALDDGTLVRRVYGDDLRNDPSIPHTAFLQYLTPGSDRWTDEKPLLDPAKYTYQLTRIRQLSDGRLIATGNVWDVPASTKPVDDLRNPSRFLIMVSGDDGHTWKEALTIPKDTGPLPGNEWDTAELYNGDLLAVMRTNEGDENTPPVLKQTILHKHGDGWVMGKVTSFPYDLTGHPELLATREGPILYFATDGIRYTQDEGKSWHDLPFPAQAQKPVTHYYPRALQTADGMIHVYSALGSDAPYRLAPQGVLQDQFRLRSGAKPAATPAS